MVTNVTSLGRSGLSDWLAQRVSALILLAYTLFLIGVFAFNPDMDFTFWQALFARLWVRIFSLLALLALCAHAWVGMWTIYTDYLNPRMVGQGGNLLRIFLQVASVILLFVYLVWGIQIIWSI